MVDGTYGDDPTNSDVDKVRFLASDRTVPFKMSDAEIEYLIARNGSPESAASAVARSIAGSLSTLADKTVGPLSIKYSEQAKSYFAIAAQIDSDNARGSGGGPILTQTDRPPVFGIGMWDNPRDVTLNPYSDWR